jgi:anaerobic magnesium-protoporphyrin IX monomethyl ester cyclase
MHKSIVLIIPPAPFLGDEKRNPPLGIMYVAAYLESFGKDVRMVDLRTIPESEWGKHIPPSRIYGITATSPEYPIAVKIAHCIRKLHSGDVSIVLGGFHAMTAPAESVDPVFDKVVLGEGEGSALEIMNAGAGDDKRFFTSAFIADLDSIPFPARHLLPRSSFISDKLCQPGDPATTISVSRGCAYNCAFCSSKAMWSRHVRFRTPGNVIREIEELIAKYGITALRFHDDTMTISKKWLHEFCDKMAPLKLSWRAHTRVDHAGYPELEAMRRAGCYEVGFGIEDPRDAVLAANNKRIKSPQIYSALKTAKEAGLKTRVYLMIGIPGQDEDTSRAMIDFIAAAEPDGVDLSTFIPVPGCDIYKRPGDFGVKVKDFKYDDLVFTVGLYGEEAEKDFLFEHDKLSGESLKQQRKEVLQYIKQRKMALNA